LFGASLAASLTTFSDYRKYDTDWSKRWEFQLAYRLLGHLWSAQRRGGVLSQTQMLDLEQQASELQIIKLMSLLRDQHIVNNDEEGNWILARDLEELSLGGLYNHGDYYLPLGEIEELPQETEWDRVFVGSLQRIRERGETEWERSLRSMYLAENKKGNAE
jgi:membrane protein